MRAKYLACVAALLLMCTQSFGWRAFNDLSWTNGQLDVNITLYTTPDGDGVMGDTVTNTGYLVNYDTGEALGCSLSVTGGDWNGGSHALNQGTNGVCGTDSYQVFNGIVDCTGVISYSSNSDVVLTFSGLDTSLVYQCIVFGNRNEEDYTYRITTNVISGCESFSNQSSTGSTIMTETTTDDGTVICSGDNTANGYVARYTSIIPGTDGEFQVRMVCFDGDTNHVPHSWPYVNAVMLQTEIESGSVIELSNAVPWGMLLAGMLGVVLVVSRARLVKTRAGGG